MTTATTQTLDARGLNCLLPILRTKKALNAMQVGETISIIASDPGSVKDMQSFCQQTGNELLSSDNSGDEYTFLISKSVTKN